MATQSRRPAASLKERLFKKPARFEFFQAVRLLRKLREGEGAEIGADDPDDEAIRFRSQLSLSFPTCAITELSDFGVEERSAVMEIGFMGIATAASFGSLPQCYTEHLLELEKAGNHAARDFFDLFNHRFISHLYRSWEKYHLGASHESEAESFYERALFGLIGLGTQGLRGRLDLDDKALLSRAGLLGMAPMPASALEGLIESYFGVPVSIKQFIPSWYAIEEDDQNRLGQRGSRLGEDMYLGSTIRLSQFKFEVRIGPLDWDAYQDFFPETDGYRALVSLVRMSITPETDFQTRPVLRAEDVPGLRLEHTPSQNTRLGWSMWLKSEETREDADQAVMAGEVFASPAASAASL
jgi:type VI secretion system protein ImpH